MKIGRCFGDFGASADVFQKLAGLGYSYIEIPLSQAAATDGGDLAALRKKAESAGLAVYASNMFFPGEISLLGENADDGKTLAYTRTALEKAEMLGIQYAVLGSGRSRARPDGMDECEAEQRLAEIFHAAAEIAAGRGITIALEPLNTGETNTVNTGAAGYELVKLVDHQNFRLLLDYYHIGLSDEDASVVQTVKDALVHCHVAAIPDRMFPMKAREADYAPFLAALRGAGYSGGVSVESDFAGEEPDGVWHLQ